MPRGLGRLAEGGLEDLQLLGLDGGPRAPPLSAWPVLWRSEEGFFNLISGLFFTLFVVCDFDFYKG